VNPIALVRRFLTLGALGVVSLVGLKSWLDKERAEMRLEYYRELAEYHAAASLSGCIRRDSVIDLAMTQGWQVREAGGLCDVAGALRVIPDAATPWRRGAPGFLIAFDGDGCQMPLPPECPFD
jgi:hypothetical protein